MAEFNPAMEVLDSWEGGYANNPNDPGGETYCGISRRNWPNWVGWKSIDLFKEIKPITWNTKFPSLASSVSEFYSDNFWNKQSFTLLDNQDVANKIFQHYVNMGNRAIKLAQGAGGVIGIDGNLGPVSCNVINILVNSSIGGTGGGGLNYFMNGYIGRLVNYYNNLIADHPQLQVFEHEWMLRSKTIGKRPNV